MIDSLGVGRFCGTTGGLFTVGACQPLARCHPPRRSRKNAPSWCARCRRICSQWIGWNDEQRRRSPARVAEPQSGGAEPRARTTQRRMAGPLWSSDPLSGDPRRSRVFPRHGRPRAAGSNWARAKTTDVRRAITTKRTTGRSASSRANGCAMYAASCNPSTSKPRSRWSQQSCPAQHAQDGRTAHAGRAFPRRARRSLPPARTPRRAPARRLDPLGQQPVHPLAPATPQRALPYHHRPPGPLRRRSRTARDPRRHRQTLSLVNRRWVEQAVEWRRGANGALRTMNLTGRCALFIRPPSVAQGSEVGIGAGE